jgi:hypothetical protein
MQNVKIQELNSLKSASITSSIIFYCLKDLKDGRIMLRWIFKKWEGVVGTGWSWLRIGRGGRQL